VIVSNRLNYNNSEDKTIRVWDMEKRTLIDTIKRENERFWILAAHPNINILGAGSDGGSIFFNLNRERIHHIIHNNNIFYIHKNQLK
jgi:coatomer protein complex subunit alpha (xenin)